MSRKQVEEAQQLSWASELHNMNVARKKVMSTWLPIPFPAPIEYPDNRIPAARLLVMSSDQTSPFYKDHAADLMREIIVVGRVDLPLSTAIQDWEEEKQQYAQRQDK